MESSELETIIYGRVEPHIYAFRTQKVPHYTKVGDTYRPTEVRIKEWEHIIRENLNTIFDESAYVDSDGEVFFRDYSVHKYLTEQLKKRNLKNFNPKGLPYYSNEFFFDTNESDINEAIRDIRQSYKDGTRKGYEFYNSIDKSHKEIIRRKKLTYELRENQKEVIKNFNARYESSDDKLNLLMYAVMRFGKSFTALQCALKMNAKLIIVVSAKVDVRDSWKKTLYEHNDFNNYYFITAKTLTNSDFNLRKNLDSGKRYVLFLSLQDLKGKDIKEKHKALFELEEPQTLLIIDETHFGARAASYGQVLLDNETTRKEDLSTTVTSDKLDIIKNFNHVRVKIHLSGTPYRILMRGEFADKDIISFVQYGDIARAQKEWDEENIRKEEQRPEWDNPYYGFPEMIRFAFHPNQESMELINQLKKKGAAGLSELFSPVSIEKSETPSFKYEDKVSGLLKAIDGTKEDKNIFPFLDYHKIKKGKMCRHMVWVLPFQSSCDAMENLLKTNALTLNRLRPYSKDFPEGYAIINISGHKCPKEYNTPEKVIDAIESFEQSNIKTITLTVNRMLTGSTVKEWDTMLMLKDTSSPQEYDQSIFRIQNPYIKILSLNKSLVNCENKEEEKVIKINMKPQTLLVDFDPSRMFRMQESKSEFYQGDNANGNNDLRHRIQEDLAVSPIICVSEDKLARVEANSIIKAVREYSKSRSVIDEANLIPSDNILLEDKYIREIIGSLDSINSKKGLELNPFEGEGITFKELEELINSLDNKRNNKHNKNDAIQESEEDLLSKKLKTFYAAILTFAFLSDSNIKYLDDIITVLENNIEDDIRIANHLGLNINILKIIRKKASQISRHHLDNRIENIHDLINNTEGSSLEKAKIALAKFDRLSSSEIVTPDGVQEALVNMIPECRVSEKSIFLDLASKQGELTIAFLKRFQSFKLCNIYSVATSTVAYEMTRKVYKALGIPVENVILPPEEGGIFFKKLKIVIDSHLPSSPNIVLCCPPFQKPKGGGRGDGGSDIYPNYFDLCKKLNPNKRDEANVPFVFGMYIKATWNTHGTANVDEFNVRENKKKNKCNKYKYADIKIPEFRKIVLNDKHIVAFNDYLNSKPFYKTNQIVTLRGGVNIFLWDAQSSNKTKIKLYIDKNHPVFEEERSLIPEGIRCLLIKNKIVDSKNQDFPYIRIGGLGLSILTKVLKMAYIHNLPFLKVCARNVFKITENVEKKYKSKPIPTDRVKTYVQKGNWIYVPKEKVNGYYANEHLVNSFKVIAAKGSPGDDSFPHSIISQPRIAENGSVCSDTYLVIKSFGINEKDKALSFVKYMKTVFFRFMVLLAKNDQNLTRLCYRFVPDIPLEQYDNIKNYFGFEEAEMNFMNMFIKEWNSDDNEGMCLNSR